MGKKGLIFSLIFSLLILFFYFSQNVFCCSNVMIIGTHDYSRIIETPHPYPGSKSGKLELVWSDYVEYKEAKYIVIEFKKFELDEGDYVEVSDREGKQIQKFEGLGFLNLGGDFITKMVFGNYVKISLYSKNREPKAYGYRIERVTRGYTDEELRKLYGGVSEPESICGTDDKQDAKCYQNTYPDVYNTGRAVCRIVMDGSALCTGWLVSCENHIITNNHCTWDDNDFDTQGELNRMEFQFGYEDPTCGGSGATVEYSFMGGTWLENDHNLDFTLVQAPNGYDPASIYGYIKWDLRVPDIDEQIYIVGHPSGRPKEISLQSTHTQDQSGFAEIYSVTESPCIGGTHQELGYFADTEGGNSGSPVISRSNNKAIGLHHCGGCPNSGLKIVDVYNKIMESSPYLPLCTIASFDGEVSFSKDYYRCNSNISIVVVDESQPPKGSGSIYVQVWSDTETTPEYVLLTENPPNSGKFEGTFPLWTGSPQNGDGKLSVQNGDTITVLYIDADDGQGGTNVPNYDYALVDCTPPSISNVQVINITATSAIVTWQTDEPSNSIVTFGANLPPSNTMSDIQNYVTSHSVYIWDLAFCTTYYFYVTSYDEAGNFSVSDNGGAYYSFTTFNNPVTIFSENFNNVVPPQLPSGWSTQVISGNAWRSSSSGCSGNALQYPYNISQAANSWVFTPGINLESGVTYTLKFNQKVQSGYYPERMEIKCGSAPNASSMDILIMSEQEYTNTSCVLRSYDFSVSTSGTYYIGFHCVSAADMYNLYVDDVVLEKPGSCEPDIVYSSHSVIDVCNGGVGDNNGIVEPGEEVVISVVVVNNGGSGSGVYGELISDSNGVVILDGLATFPDVGSGGSVSSEAPHFRIKVNSDVECGSVLNFRLRVYCNENEVGSESSFSIEVGYGGGEVLLYSENFDGVSAPNLPSGWGKVNVSGTAGDWFTNVGTRYPAGGGSASAPNVACFNSYTASSGNSTRLYMTSGISIPSDISSCTLKFYMYHDNGFSGRNDRIQVQVSVNGGSSWVDVGSPIMRYSSVNGWVEHSISLDSYRGYSDVRIGFLGISEYGNDCHIDNVKVVYPGEPICNVCIGNIDPPGEVSPGDVITNALRFSDRDTLVWSGGSGAINGYRVYRGIRSDLVNLLNSNVDFCLRGEVTNLSLEVGLDDPSLEEGRCYYYLVTAYNDAGEGSAGYASGNIERILNPTGGCN